MCESHRCPTVNSYLTYLFSVGLFLCLGNATGATAVWHIMIGQASVRSVNSSTRKIIIIIGAGFQAKTEGRSAMLWATATQQEKDVRPRTATLARV